MIKQVGLVLMVIIGIVIAIGLYIFRPIINFDESKIPKDLVTSPFLDFDRIYAISKFRSGAGHDYSHGAINGETCRSMKHYFNMSRSQDPQTHRPIRSQPTEGEPNIKIYAPFDGKITSASAEHIGTQVHISSDKYPYYIRIFHMDLLPEFKSGSKVRSGEWIGTIGPKDGTDFAVEANTLQGTVYLSYFEVMTDQVFEQFKNLGFKREDFIISKEYRDAHPFRCGGVQTNPLNKTEETFQHEKNRGWMEDYIFVREDPYPQPGQSPVQIGPPQK
ncbi:peptidoglycan DD-metalloendopeptidase family protein [Candidatus Daviesbacteria bacterium]|nr:peptidoglycan DD-metalloendopeptidase family protein [Candidatus Daviesbacteria bacterium]